MYRVTLRVDSNEKASEGPKNPPVNITEVPSGIAHEDLFRYYVNVVKLRQGSGKDWQGMAVKEKGLKALSLAKSLH